jgi:hypothetical protein
MFKVEADSRNNLVIGSSLDEVNHIEEPPEITFLFGLTEIKLLQLTNSTDVVNFPFLRTR